MQWGKVLAESPPTFDNRRPSLGRSQLTFLSSFFSLLLLLRPILLILLLSVASAIPFCCVSPRSQCPSLPRKVGKTSAPYERVAAFSASSQLMGLTRTVSLNPESRPESRALILLDRHPVHTPRVLLINFRYRSKSSWEIKCRELMYDVSRTQICNFHLISITSKF